MKFPFAALFGAHQDEVVGTVAIHFVYGHQNVRGVHLIGDFTDWYEIKSLWHVMKVAYKVFTDLPKEGDIYKYNIKQVAGKKF